VTSWAAVNRIGCQQPPQNFDAPAAFRRAARWNIETAKQSYPVILFFAIFAILIVATLALRIAIWVPMWLAR